MERNQKLDYADWDARDTDQRSYFTLKVRGGCSASTRDCSEK